MLSSLPPEYHAGQLSESRIQGCQTEDDSVSCSAPPPEGVWVRFGEVYYLVRPLRPSDMRTLQNFFYSHTKETIRFRYGYPRKWMSDESAYKLASVDQRKDPALGIFAEVDGEFEFRAIGRYYLDEGGKSAEIAFVVHENTRNLGMAGYLIAKLAEIASERGIEEFWANVLPDNRTMANLFVAVGGKGSRVIGEDDLMFNIDVENILRTRRKFLEEKHIEVKKR